MQRARGARHGVRRGRPSLTALAAAVTTVGLVGATVGAAPGAAQAPPEKVLQAVEIDLGTDGTINALRSTEVRQGVDADDTSSRRLDPSEHAGALPVRVTTSWSHDGKVGTDLAQLEGVSGRVRVDLTVQNTTVEAQRFRYDASGVARDAYELVATPLTVVASARLPEGAVRRVTQPPAGTTSPNATNGVVAVEPDGTTTVQWASLLAPPRLASTTTFTLVGDAADFALADLTLSVQPGLATDASITRLLGDAFGGSSALIGSENNTITLIAKINDTLAETRDDLQRVRETLSVNAGELGTATTRRLDAAAGELDASAASVRSDLVSLDSSVSSALQTTRSESLTALSQSVQGLLSFLGTPGSRPAAPPAADEDAAAGCDATAELARDAAPTLLGQLGQVSTLLREVSTASEACVTQVRTGIADSIGADRTCDTVVEATTLVCRLDATSGQLGAVAQTIASEGAKILGAFDATITGKVGEDLGSLVTVVEDLQQDARSLKSGGGETEVEQLELILTTMQTTLTTLRAGTAATATVGIAGSLNALHDLALTRSAALDGGPTSVTGQLEALAAEICGSPREAVVSQLDDVLALLNGSDKDEQAGIASAKAALEAYSDRLRRQVDGEACAAIKGADTGTVTIEQPVGDDLLLRIGAEAAQWDGVAAGTDLSAKKLTGAAEAVVALDGQLAGLQGKVAEALRFLRGSGGGGSFPGSRGGGLKEAVDGLVTQVGALYDAGAGKPACAPTDATAPTTPLNVLRASFSTLTCKQSTTAGDLTKLLQLNLPTYAAAAGVAETGAVDALAASRSGDGQLGTLLTALTGQLATTADRQLEQGDDVVRQLGARLVAQREAAARDLDAAAQAAIASLAAEIDRSVVQQAAASAALQDQLSRVLVDLGSAAAGQGLLGLVQDSASRTGVRTQQVEGARSEASSFRGVRRAELADAQLEQRQVARSLEAAQTFPPFALELPAGSSYAGVFVIAVRPVG